MGSSLLVPLGIFAASVVAGTFGAMLGLGGGIIVIPVLTLIFGVPMKEAIATSLVTVIATSTSAAVVYVENHFTNVRLGMVLEMATTVGALIGGFLVVKISPGALRFLFSALLIFTAITMARKAGSEATDTDQAYVHVRSSTTEDEYNAHISNGLTPYRIKNYPAGIGASLFAGAISGLLGVGGGIIKVPAMRLLMGVPMRVAIATSNFMIGVTAATSGLIYYSRGLVDPVVTAPSVLGVLVGAQFGTRLVKRINKRALTWLFVVVLIFTAAQMIWRALHGGA